MANEKQIYKTAKGREIDMMKLVRQNELVPAVGNAKVNARGDKLGPGGKIIIKREERQTAANQIPEQLSVRAAPEPVITPEEVEPAPIVVEQPVKPLTPAQKAKAIKDMDPEGNE
jgi:hypothetical protein